MWGKPSLQGQWHRYQVWSRAVASKNPLCALTSGQPSCHWGTWHWCGESQRFKRYIGEIQKHTLHKPIYTTYGPQRSHLSTLPQVQGFWDKWLIRVAVLFVTTKKRKTKDFFKCFICYTGKYDLSPQSGEGFLGPETVSKLKGSSESLIFTLKLKEIPDVRYQRPTERAVQEQSWRCFIDENY